MPDTAKVAVATACEEISSKRTIVLCLSSALPIHPALSNNGGR